LLTNNLFLNATENIFYSASSLKQQSADRHISFHSDTSSCKTGAQSSERKFKLTGLNQILEFTFI
jgi:hypothetical protein